MINNEEFFRLINYPTLEGFIASFSNNEEEGIKRAEDSITEIRFILDKKINELNYLKLRREFSFTLKTSTNDDLHDYSTLEAGKILGRTQATIRNYINSGQLKSYRTFNGDIRISKEELERFINTLRKRG